MKPSLIFTLVVLLLIFVVLPICLLRRRNKNPFLAKHPKLPYLRRPLMTATEMDVCSTLLEALPDYMVFSQVQASRVLEVPKSEQERIVQNIPALMASVGKGVLDVPLVAEVGIGKNWDDAH